VRWESRKEGPLSFPGWTQYLGQKTIHGTGISRERNVSKKAPNAKVKGVLVQKMYHFGREVIVGMKRDPIFGPMIMFGLGGVYVEVMKDVSFRIAPFSLEEARKMIHEVKAIKLLQGVRGEAPADIEKIAETIGRISQLAIDFPEIQELDINPLLVMSKGKGVVAVDVRMIVQKRKSVLKS